MKVEPEVLFDKLVNMSQQELYDYCVEQEIRGYTQDDSSCVLAKLFLRDTTCSAIRISDYLQWTKNSDEITEWDMGDWGEQREASPEMRKFISDFDNDRYPELVLEFEDYE